MEEELKVIIISHSNFINNPASCFSSWPCQRILLIRPWTSWRRTMRDLDRRMRPSSGPWPRESRNEAGDSSNQYSKLVIRGSGLSRYLYSCYLISYELTAHCIAVPIFKVKGIIVWEGKFEKILFLSPKKIANSFLYNLSTDLKS